MDRFVKTHLDRTNRIVYTHFEEEFICQICRTQVRENKSIYIHTCKFVERECLVAQRLVHCKVQLHLSVYQQFRVIFMQLLYCPVNFCGTSALLSTEVGIRQHGHYRLVGKELNRMDGQSGYIHQCILVRVRIYKCIGKEVCTFFRRYDMHRTEMIVFGTYSDNILGNLHSLGVIGICSGYKGICLSCFNHHHTEIGTVEHLFISFIHSYTAAFTFLCKYLCITATSFIFVIMTQVHNLYTCKVEVVACSSFGNHFVVSQQYGLAYTLFVGRYGSRKHVYMICFGKYDTFRILLCHVCKTAHQLVVVSHSCTQTVFICIPVGYLLTCHTGIYCSLCNGRSYACQQPRVESFRYDIFRAETYSLYIICGIYHFRYMFFCQTGYCIYGCEFHVLVYLRCMNVQCSAEYVGESQYVVYLIGIVGTTRGEYKVGT